MAIGEGESRPYTPKKPDKDELNVEDLYREFRNLQRRNKWLQGVRLELTSKMSESGSGGLFYPSYFGDDNIQYPARIQLVLPALRKNFEIVKGYPKTASDRPKRPTFDFTKYVKATLRHEAAHVRQLQQTRIRNVLDEPQTKPTKGRAAYLDMAGHGKLYNILNSMLAGSGSEVALPKIGLPPILSQAYWSRQGQLTPRG